jgi:hypothetical protein
MNFTGVCRASWSKTHGKHQSLPCAQLRHTGKTAGPISYRSPQPDPAPSARHRPPTPRPAPGRPRLVVRARRVPPPAPPAPSSGADAASPHHCPGLSPCCSRYLPQPHRGASHPIPPSSPDFARRSFVAFTTWKPQIGHATFVTGP